MPESSPPPAIQASSVEPRRGVTIYPAPFAARVAGRERRVLGDLFGLVNFGVNLTRLAPGSMSALRHVHSRQDEFIYVVEGQPTRWWSIAARPFSAPACAPASRPAARPTISSTAPARTRSISRSATAAPATARFYPDDDLATLPSPDGRTRVMLHKDGTPWK